MSKWTDHVKKYSQDHNVSYKDALSLSKSSYNKSGGALNINTVGRKTKNTLNTVGRKTKNTAIKAEKIARKARNTVNTVADVAKYAAEPMAGAGVKNIGRKTKNTLNTVGRKTKNTALKAETIARKARNTVNTVADIAKYAAVPMAAANPPLGLALESAALAAENLTGGKLGSKKNKYIGGSFAVPHRNGGSIGGCPTCGAIMGSGVPSSSSLMSSNHSSFAPLPPKSYAQLKVNN